MKNGAFREQGTPAKASNGVKPVTLIISLAIKGAIAGLTRQLP